MKWIAVIALTIFATTAQAAAACVITLHTPNGHPFKVRIGQIGMVRSITPDEHDHLVRNTNTVLLIGGRHQGVRETEQEIEQLERCERPRPATGAPRRLVPDLP